MMLLSPAKVNLSFCVKRKREDGFHDIETLFQVVSLFDALEFSFSDQNTLITQSPDVPLDETNLIFKASEVFQEESGKSFHLKVSLDKKIPIGAGLGGGSSNAATTLWALNKMHGSPLSIQRLMQLGAKIGSDVSLFFTHGTAIGEGRGEILTEKPIYDTPQMWLALPKGISLATPLVYQTHVVGKSLHTLFCNDLETAAFKLVPKLKNYKTALLKKGFSYVFMTGSGSALVCIGEPRDLNAEKITLIKVTPISRNRDSWWHQ